MVAGPGPDDEGRGESGGGGGGGETRRASVGSQRGVQWGQEVRTLVLRSLTGTRVC